ncbi:ankyrin repeat protein [Trichoderma cornu-damae]|uniref:Ankyrin repeat protein n=1 Tax=Trichoderma cornu-damae TaxID=654480 RepID=A0A9P8TTE7_9HYPO|nr:ankyrin repeat protein [Trichoderma cornu-damae]
MNQDNAAPHPSEAPEAQPVILNYDLLQTILTEYAETQQDVLNFILASKLYHRLFFRNLHKYNVRHGGCSALGWAAERGDMALVATMLNTPNMEALAPKDAWADAITAAQRTDNMELAKLLFRVEAFQNSTRDAARAAAQAAQSSAAGTVPTYKDSLLQPLFDAASADQQELMELYVSHGVDVNLRDGFDETCLYKAAVGGNVPLATLLLGNHGADPSIGRSPLVAASETGSAELVELLLSHGANPCSGGTGGYSVALKLAATQGYRDVVRLLLLDGRVNAEARSDDGLAILDLHSMSNQPEVVRLFLSLGRVDPNRRRLHGWYLLLAAAINTEPHGPALLNVLLSDERTNTSLVSLYGRNALALTVLRKRLDSFKILLSSGKVDPDEGDVLHMTPVMYAARGKSSMFTEMLELLLADKRVDPNRADRYGETALMWAVQENRVDNVRLLLSSGRVCLDQKDALGQTALMMACLNLNAPLVKLLLAARSGDPSERDSKNQDAMMRAIVCAPVAVRASALDVAKAILEAGYSPLNICDEEGGTLLEFAAQTGKGELVEFLLSHGKATVTPRAMKLCGHNSEIRGKLEKAYREQ